MKTKYLKIIVVLVLLLLVVASIFCLIWKYSTPFLAHAYDETNEYYATDNGSQFRVQYLEYNFPDEEHLVNIYDVENDKLIYHAALEIKNESSEFLQLYDDKEFCCVLFFDEMLLYKNGEGANVIEITDADKIFLLTVTTKEEIYSFINDKVAQSD